MINLALCDDEADQLNTLKRLLSEYTAVRPEFKPCLSIFSSGQELLLSEQPENFDLYLLDVVMPELSGIELGVKLRERGCDGAIIYLTFSPEYAVHSYEARAFYYLLKPVQPEQFYSVMDQALVEIERQKTSCILVRTRDSVIRIPLDSILWAELSRRSVCYHLLNADQVNSVTVRQSFQEEVKPLLTHANFALCGASFVVNLYYVKAVEKNFLTLEGGIRIPLPRSAAAQIRQQWMDYWLNASGRAVL